MPSPLSDSGRHWQPITQADFIQPYPWPSCAGSAGNGSVRWQRCSLAQHPWEGFWQAPVCRRVQCLWPRLGQMGATSLPARAMREAVSPSQEDARWGEQTVWCWGRWFMGSLQRHCRDERLWFFRKHLKPSLWNFNWPALCNMSLAQRNRHFQFAPWTGLSLLTCRWPLVADISTA